MCVSIDNESNIRSPFSTRSCSVSRQHQIKMKPGKPKKFIRSFSKFRKKGIKIVGKWKPVQIDPNLFADDNLGDVVCFEELTEYELLDSSKVLKSKGKKRLLGDAEKEELNEEEEEEDEEEPSRKSKRKKRRARENAASIEENNNSETEQGEASADDEDYQADESQHTDHADEGDAVTEMGTPQEPTRKKKKKKKRVKKKAPPSVEMTEPPKASKKVKNWSANTNQSSTADKHGNVSAWKDLFVPAPVLQALSYLGFSAPTPIQALALPSAIRDHMDILGAAETGSGKTLAFAIPMIHSILEWQKSRALRNDEEEDYQSVTDDPSLEGVEKKTLDEDTLEDIPRPLNEEDDNDNGDDEDDGDETANVGCVKVLQNVDFDFNVNTPTAKTLAMDKTRPLLGLVVAPTRELAVQVKHHIDAVARFTGIKAAIIVGGMAAQKQERVLNRRPEIVIATPGRLWELIKDRHPHLSNLRQLRCLVIDEADRMVERGHFVELSQLLELLNDSVYNPKRQTFVFSATLTLIHQAPLRVLQKKNSKKMDRESKLDALIQKIGMRGKPKVIDLTRKEATVETLTETKIHCEANEKDYYLYYFLLQYPGRTMVFANSIDCIKRLNGLLTILDCTPLPLHANMHQKQRLKNLERFAERDNCILLSTDVAARGLDIPNVQHVLHYQVPRTSELYVHRSGRTARAANEGLSLLLIGPDDVVNFRNIYKTLEKNEELPVFPVEDRCMAGIKERVDLARQIEKLEFHNSKAKQHNSWFQQAAEAMEIDLDDDLLMGGRDKEQEDHVKQKMLKGMKKQLKRLLGQPVARNLMKTKYPTQGGKLQLAHLHVAASETALSTISKQRQKKKKPARNSQTSSSIL
ncbi:ATP-dependent RNA helicase DDX24 [Ambystoma mexicanum]|uniref:ATP-dependent RNA helicase DDX24 n=1 Tax=Ambystoma mexicanum TaxID=8296 RepID=UPI0037E8B3AC